MTRILATAVLLFAGMLACAGCAPDARETDSDPTITIVDGTIIVDNPGLHIADSTAWSVDATPVVRIGVVEGAEEYMIGRLAGMIRRDDGSIIVADAIAHELRVYDEVGRFQRRVGRAGEGPGEYGWLTAILPHVADTIVVMDNEHGRANVLDPDLRFVRRYRPALRERSATPGMTSHRLFGFFSDGTALFTDYINPCGGARREAFCEDSVAFVRADAEGNVLTRFGTFVYSRMEMKRVSPGLSTGWGEPHPQAYWTLHRDRFYYADSRRFAVHVYDLDGVLERVMRVRVRPPRYSREDVFAVLPVSAEQASDERGREAYRVYVAARQSAAVPDTLPSFSGLLVDGTGHVWLREYRPASPGGPTRWFVLDPVGRLRYAVRLPPGLLVGTGPLDRLRPRIGADHVLGGVRDEDGVESVVVHPLRKRQPPDP